MPDTPAPAPKPIPRPITADLTWIDGLRFQAASGSQTFITDGRSTDGPSPVQLLAVGLAGCMAMDVVNILLTGKHSLTGLQTALVGERLAEAPRRLVRIQLRFEVSGDVPRPAIQRALDLSRDRYCSVWHSMRHDIALDITFDVRP